MLSFFAFTKLLFRVARATLNVFAAFRTGITSFTAWRALSITSLGTWPLSVFRTYTRGILLQTTKYSLIVCIVNCFRIYIYIIQILCVCVSVKYRRPNGWTDHDQIWHVYADRPGNGSYQNKRSHVWSGRVGSLGPFFEAGT